MRLIITVQTESGHRRADLSASELFLIKCGAEQMAIGNVVQRGSFIYVYDEKGHQTASMPAGSAAGDGLKGYTSSTVNIRRSSFIYTYDEKGRQISSTPAGK